MVIRVHKGGDSQGNCLFRDLFQLFKTAVIDLLLAAYLSGCAMSAMIPAH